MDWTQFSTIVADTPAQIRRADVYRLLDEAQHAAGGAEGLRACAQWLQAQRPDLLGEITQCMDDLDQEEEARRD